MKAFVAYLAHESHSFSPLPTSIECYREDFLYIPSSGEGLARLDEEVSADMALAGQLRARGHELAIGLIAGAMPGAPTGRADYELLRRELLESLRKALPVDAVFLFLHGAQMAQGCDDCEGDIIAHARDIVGEKTPIAVALDLHCNLSPAMVENGTAIIACKEYPHTDFAERSAELIDIVENTLAGDCQPRMAMARVPMLGVFHTTSEPMRGFVDGLSAREFRDGVLSISLMHSYPYGDSANTSASVLVVSDGDRQLAQALADEYAERFFALRKAIAAPVVSVEQALQQALENHTGTVVIADTTDNPGGGAAGDSTGILKALLDAGIRDAALAMIWDPMAVAAAIKAGVGARLPLRVGGKIGPLSGDPLDLDAVVKSVRRNASQVKFGIRATLGVAVAIETRGIEIVINSSREQVHDPACFSEFGIDPWSKRILVVKSAQHFHEKFSPHAAQIIYADSPGTVTSDFHSLPYQKLVRPIWPIDKTPFRVYGKHWV